MVEVDMIAGADIEGAEEDGFSFRDFLEVDLGGLAVEALEVVVDLVAAAVSADLEGEVLAVEVLWGIGSAIKKLHIFGSLTI